VVGLLPAGQGDKDHVLPAGLLDLPGGDETSGVAQQDDLQDNLGIVGGAPRLIIAVLLLKTRRIQPGFHQRVNSELQGPGHQLIFQRNWQEHPLPIIVCLEFSHGHLFSRVLTYIWSHSSTKSVKLTVIKIG
jgi:hypothetical protein